MFPSFGEIVLTQAQSMRFANGGAIDRGRLKGDPPVGEYRVYSPERVFLGLARLGGKELAAGKYTQYGPYVHNDIVVAARAGSRVWNSARLSGRNMAMCTTPEAMAALETDEKLMNRLGRITRLVGGTTECFAYLYGAKCDAVLTDSTAVYYYNSH